MPQASSTIESIPRYTLQPTDNVELSRLVNMKGDWIVYFHHPTSAWKWSVSYVLKHGFPKDERFLSWLLSKTKEEANTILQETGSRGTKVHAAIRDLIDGKKIEFGREYRGEKTGAYEKLMEDEWDCLLAFQRWCAIFNPKVNARETAVWHSDFAGTLDFSGTITIPAETKVWIDDKKVSFPRKKTIKVLLDWKTGGGIWDEHKIANAFYDLASGEHHQATGVVRFGTKHVQGWEMELWSKKRTKEHLQNWNATVQNFHLKVKPFSYQEELLPLTIAINIPIIEKKGKEVKNADSPM